MSVGYVSTNVDIFTYRIRFLIKRCTKLHLEIIENQNAVDITTKNHKFHVFLFEYVGGAIPRRCAVLPHKISFILLNVLLVWNRLSVLIGCY